MKKRRIYFGFVLMLLIAAMVVGGIYLFNYWTEHGGGISDKSMMTYRLYDADRKLIKGTTQSIVEGTPGVYYIDITIRVDNIGTEGLVCEITSLSPSEFDDSVTRTQEVVPIGASRAWTSDLIDVAPLEQISESTTFSAEVTCSYVLGDDTIYLAPISGTLPLVIRPDFEGAGFQVGLAYGGVATEFCGDGICQPDEDSVSCPTDCGVSANVQFRTTDLSYVSGTAVGYAASCGTSLTAYGKTSGACVTLGHYCDDTDYTLLIPSLSGTTRMWYEGEDICICDPDDEGIHTYSKRYNIGDSDASKVDTSEFEIDASKEVPC